MFNSKPILTILASAFISFITFPSCSSQDDLSDCNSTPEISFSANDTIFIEAAPLEIEKSEIGNLSSNTLNLLMNNLPSISRSNDNIEIYHIYDESTDRNAYAVTPKDNPNICIYECYGAEQETPVLMMFEQTESNKFIVKNEDGEELRTFIFDPNSNELWTFNPKISSRGLSSSDRVLCGAAFTAACFLTCEALAVPSGGASLFVELCFFAVSIYVCD